MNRYVRRAVLLVCVVPAASAPAQSAVDAVDDALVALAVSVPTPPIAFVGIPPCRLADTRGNGFTGAFGPPSMIAVTPRVFPVASHCGIPATAQAVSANLAVTNTSGVGFISVWPGGSRAGTFRSAQLQGRLHSTGPTSRLRTSAAIPSRSAERGRGSAPGLLVH